MGRWPTWRQKLALFRRFGYCPSRLQARAHRMIRPGLLLPQVGLILGGERAGKSYVTGHEAAAMALWCELVFIAGMEYENTEPEFEYMISALARLGAVLGTRTPKNDRWTAELRTGCQVRTVSFRQKGPDALIATGKAPGLIVLSEAGLLQFSHFQAAFARVAEKRGAVLAAGTLKGSRPWYAEMYRLFQGDNHWNGRAVSLPSWGNRVVYPGGEDEPTIQALRGTFDELTFAERFGAEPVPSALLVFGRDFSHELHVKRCEYDPELPVEVAIDPGYAGAYAVEVVQWASSSDVRVVDEYYRQYSLWHEAVAWVKALPYAERIRSGVGDVAIHQHHSDRSQFENWAANGIVLRSQAVTIEDGISRMRDFLRSPFNGKPRLTIDPKAEGLIWEYGRESYPADQDGQPLKDVPIDRFNHARKALSYWLVDRFGVSDFERPKSKAGTRRGDRFAGVRRAG